VRRLGSDPDFHDIANPRDGGFQRVHDLFVFEPDDSKPTLLEIFLAGGVFFGLLNVNPAIELDDELGLGAVEIHDEGVDRMLSAEADATQSSVAKLVPQELFG